MTDSLRLAEAARTWARGSYALEAAVELLIRHGVWLRRPDLLRAAVDYVTTTSTGAPYAVFDWQAAADALNIGDLPCSSSEAAVLRIAVSLADGIPVELGPAVTGLDSTNLAYLIAAIQHANGNRSALSLSRGSAYSLVRDGTIPALKRGGRWVIPKRRFHAWLDGMTESEAV